MVIKTIFKLQTYKSISYITYVKVLNNAYISKTMQHVEIESQTQDYNYHFKFD